MGNNIRFHLSTAHEQQSLQNIRSVPEQTSGKGSDIARGFGPVRGTLVQSLAFQRGFDIRWLPHGIPLVALTQISRFHPEEVLL